MAQLTHPWDKRQEIPDVLVRDAADQFENARRLLAAQPPGSGLLLPEVNMAAIAIELYLKCLSAKRVYESIEGGVFTISAAPVVASHCLTSLLGAVGLDLETDLDRAFRAASIQYCNLAFRDALKKCEGAFEASRYSFEAKHDMRGYPLPLINRVAQFLGEFVAGLEPIIYIHPPSSAPSRE